MSTFPEDIRSSWVVATGVENMHWSSQYLAAFYWAIATMMAVGYGDIYAQNNAERLYSIITQFIGAVMLGFIIANVSQFMETFDPRATKEKAKQDGLTVGSKSVALRQLS